MNSEDLQQMQSLLAKVETLASGGITSIDYQSPDFQAFTQNLPNILKIAASMGECRRARPFAKVRPVIDENGKLMWCCNHEKEHCGEDS